MAIKNIIESMIEKANEVTGKIDTTLTQGIQSLIDGYGSGGASIPEGYIELDDGVILPIPNYDKTKNYKSAFVRKNFQKNAYEFVTNGCLIAYFWEKQNAIYQRVSTLGYERWETPIENPMEWTLSVKNTSDVLGSYTIDSERFIVWSNMPIYKESTLQEVYFAPKKIIVL